MLSFRNRPSKKKTEKYFQKNADKLNKRKEKVQNEVRRLKLKLRQIKWSRMTVKQIEKFYGRKFDQMKPEEIEEYCKNNYISIEKPTEIQKQVEDN